LTDQNISPFTSVEEILEYAMADEQDASSFYLEASKKVEDPNLKKCLIMLSEMEVEHYNILKNKLEECRANQFSAQAIISSFQEES
jgi:rubrerythrin